MSKIAFIYPGQGAQACGMGQDFYENEAIAREVYDQASEWLSLDMKALCFEENDKLNQTEYTQAALVTTCMAMEKVFAQTGVKADITAGLSLGEYCAIHTAGGMTLEDAVKTVRLRGILMQDTVPLGQGAMAAVMNLEAEKIEEVLQDREGVWIANYNCPGQIVITGESQAVADAAEPLKEAGARKVLPLKVSGPFHSPMLVPAGEKLGEALANVNFAPLQIPYITNVTAEIVSDSSLCRNLLIRQVSSSVKWMQSMQQLLAEGYDTFVEIGPGRTLAGFMKKIDRSVKVVNVAKLADVETAAAAILCTGD